MTEPVMGATYGVELFFDRPYDLASPKLAAALRAGCPRSDVHTKDGMVAVFHTEVTNPQGAPMPAQTVVLGSDAPIDVATLAGPIAQSRDWPEARAVVERARYRLLVTDILSSFLPAPLRLEIFQHVLRAVVEALAPIAISWGPAGSVVNPARFVEAMASGKEEERMLVAMNVRLFRAEGEGDECVMDTLGLGALGLTDVQVHFRGLDLNEVARLLFNTGLYVMQKGDVLADGNTVRGIAEGQKWKCRREGAIAPPKREVVDLDPGAPFAAGDRGEASG